jgi:hypothetical protein
MYVHDWCQNNTGYYDNNKASNTAAGMPAEKSTIPAATLKNNI